MDWVRGRRVFDNAPNQNLPFIPPFRWRNEVEYDYVKGWLGVSFMAVRKQDQVAPEEEVTEGYGLLGFQAGYRGGAACPHCAGRKCFGYQVP
jgi:iron complex outermembrane recepter protein